MSFEKRQIQKTNITIRIITTINYIEYTTADRNGVHIVNKIAKQACLKYMYTRMFDIKHVY